MSSGVNQFYRFGEFTVDREQRVLLRNDSPLPLAPKVFDTLLILVENNGRIVEKEELMRRLWPDTFVEESNLTFNIKELRKALGDNARQPRFIETVARRGYRFISEVSEHSPPAINSETELNKIGLAVSPAPRYLVVAALALLVVGSVAIIWRFVAHRSLASASSAPILSAAFRSEKFAGAGLAVITPDGKYVAYTSETGGKASLWLRQLATSESIQIVPPANERYFGLAISHDGNSLYFVRAPPTNPLKSIYRVMTFGGIPVKITDDTQTSVSLSPDDKQLSFIRCYYREEDFCSLYVVGSDGNNERKVLTRKSPMRLAGAQFSPDGKSIALASGQSWNGGSDFRLMRVDLASGTESALAARSFFNIWDLKWLPDGDTLLFTASENLDGRFRIWQVSARTGEARSLTNDATDYITLSLDKAADKMVATHSSDTFHLYVARMDDLNNPTKLTVARTGFAFAPDRRIVYEGNDGDIWMINVNGGEQHQLTNDTFKDYRPLVSPDGRYIFFTSNRSGSNQIWRMNPDGANQIQITKRIGGYPVFVSTDGKWVFFESGLKETLWQVSSEGGDENEVSNQKVLNPSFSSDGRLVAYFFREEKHNRLGIKVMSVETRTVLRTFILTDDIPHPGRIAWMNDNQTFYYVTGNGSQNFLWRQSFANDTTPHLMAGFGNEEIAYFALSPDDSTVAFISGRWILNSVLIEGLK